MIRFIIIHSLLFMAFLGVAVAHKGAATSLLFPTISRGGGGYKRMPTHIVVAAYSDENKADEVAEVLKGAAESGLLHFRNMAVVRKDEDGGVRIQETGDMTVPYASMVGMMLGGLSLLVLGPAGVLAGSAAGALVGGAGEVLMEQQLAQDSDPMLDRQRFFELGDVLKEGTSALVVVFEEVLVNRRRTKNVKMKLLQDVVLEELESKLRRALEKGRDIAFLLSITNDGIKSVRTVKTKRSTDIQAMFNTRKGKMRGLPAETTDGMVYGVGSGWEGWLCGRRMDPRDRSSYR